MRRLRDISANVSSANAVDGATSNASTLRQDGASALLGNVSLTLTSRKVDDDVPLGNPPDYDTVLVEEGRRPRHVPRRREELPPDISVTR